MRFPKSVLLRQRGCPPLNRYAAYVDEPPRMMFGDHAAQSITLWNWRFLLTTACVSLTFLISGPTLNAFGIEYVTTGGNPLFKIHPATYLSVFTIIVLALGGELNHYLEIIREEKFGLTYYLLSWLALELFIITSIDMPATGTIDTFLLAGMLAFLIFGLKENEKSGVEIFIDLFILANCIISIGELLLGSRFIPVTIGSLKLGIMHFPNEWRPGGFLGHPLANATVTGSYFLINLVNERKLQFPFRMFMLGLTGITLLACGSRAAIAFLVVCAAFFFCREFANGLTRGAIRKDIVSIFVIIVPAMSIGLVLLLSSGILDKFIARIYEDGGSALSRSLMFRLMGDLTWRQIVFPSSGAWSADLVQRYGMMAVESFWLGFILLYGLVGTVIFWPGLYAFCRSIMRHTQGYAPLLVLYFFANASVSASISSKTLEFALFAVLILVKLRPDERTAFNAAHYRLASKIELSPYHSARSAAGR